MKITADLIQVRLVPANVIYKDQEYRKRISENE